MHLTPSKFRSVLNENSSSERRITPSWTISELKTRLEPITGIPSSCQLLFLKASSTTTDQIAVTAPNEDNTQLVSFPLAPHVELHVKDTRPPSARPNYTDVSGVEKYVMPEEEYEKKTDSVLAWKKAQQLGRFDPNAPSAAAARRAAMEEEVRTKGIAPGKRCRVGAEDSRRGLVMYVGDVPEIPGDGVWIGVELDEPVGKNNGAVGGKRYWGDENSTGHSQMNHGVFVRPERVEVGDWPPLGDLEDMEEI